MLHFFMRKASTLAAAAIPAVALTAKVHRQSEHNGYIAPSWFGMRNAWCMQRDIMQAELEVERQLHVPLTQLEHGLPAGLLLPRAGGGERQAHESSLVELRKRLGNQLRAQGVDAAVIRGRRPSPYVCVQGMRGLFIVINLFKVLKVLI